jgi:hypothetical protein
MTRAAFFRILSLVHPDFVLLAVLLCLLLWGCV